MKEEEQAIGVGLLVMQEAGIGQLGIGNRKSGIGKQKLWRGGGRAVAIVRTATMGYPTAIYNPWLTARQITAQSADEELGIRNRGSERSRFALAHSLQPIAQRLNVARKATRLRMGLA